ncbi:peptidase A24A prepilin type IV [Halorubrum californiense DSM 19288]|uniref:Peptidase A24A prepilin type IV n=1 Tax=Halorubrum californiense DSM 19288 TaxID=1227465 RepID=M0EFT9_9EURY|nr:MULTISPECIES: A24 family peptidase [Halorubrum]ELZ46610.1 peptidase A24A prepilin type IV [Halorubrum californiense DSM 19288]TKX68049.1 A24 family peptidase [Halorubrum sp. GN11GM_10-3_MGM]
MIATLPDLLRLVVVPVFAWAALRDVRTRRLPNRLWPPLYLFGALLLLWEAVSLWPFAGFDGRIFLVRAAISLLFVAPLGYAFWYLGAFGGADAKAMIALAILFPTFPAYDLAGVTLPLVDTQLGVFSLTILTNTVLLGLAYPVGLAALNLVRGETSRLMFFARPVATDSLPDRHGRLFEAPDGPTRGGLDLDALRMYLRWRGLTLADLRSDPDGRRHPDSVGETFDPTDGGTHVGPRTDGGRAVDDAPTDGGRAVDDAPSDGERAVGAGTVDAADRELDDPWAAERFLDDIDHGAYGTDAATLREGLDVVAREDRVLVSPGMPFVVPMAVGLVVSLTFGDALFALLGALGLV